MAEIIFRPAAEQELEEAFRWYEEHQAGLGDKFCGALKRIFK